MQSNPDTTDEMREFEREKHGVQIKHKFTTKYQELSEDKKGCIHRPNTYRTFHQHSRQHCLAICFNFPLADERISHSAGSITRSTQSQTLMGHHSSIPSHAMVTLP